MDIKNLNEELSKFVESWNGYDDDEAWDLLDKKTCEQIADTRDAEYYCVKNKGKYYFVAIPAWDTTSPHIDDIFDTKVECLQSIASDIEVCMDDWDDDIFLEQDLSNIVWDRRVIKMLKNTWDEKCKEVEETQEENEEDDLDETKKSKLKRQSFIKTLKEQDLKEKLVSNRRFRKRKSEVDRLEESESYLVAVCSNDDKHEETALTSLKNLEDVKKAFGDAYDYIMANEMTDENGKQLDCWEPGCCSDYMGPEYILNYGPMYYDEEQGLKSKEDFINYNLDYINDTFYNGDSDTVICFYDKETGEVILGNDEALDIGPDDRDDWYYDPDLGYENEDEEEDEDYDESFEIPSTKRFEKKLKRNLRKMGEK